MGPGLNAGRSDGGNASCSRQPKRDGWRALGRTVCLAALAGGPWVATARAQPLLHEYVELGPGQSTVAAPDSKAPAKSERRATRPPEGSPTNATDFSPGTLTPGSAPTFQIDRDTRRADSVTYDDPFIPSVAPFKRSVVYDTVYASGELAVRDPTWRSVPVRETASASDEHFHATFELNLERGKLEPLPSVAPGASVAVLHELPARGATLWMDSAENWHVRAAQSGPLRLTLQIAVDRAAFEGALTHATWAELAAHLPQLPNAVRAEARAVARALGVHREQTPAVALRKLVRHFRGFKPSDQPPQSSGLELYRELALSARGICRHRSYAFMITALGLGIPTRLALNEAHAWVEVRGARAWHRIDLGGAANQIALGNPDRPRQVAPRDPLSWPEDSASGLSMLTANGAPDRPAIGPAEADANDSASSHGGPEPPATQGSREAAPDPGDGQAADEAVGYGPRPDVVPTGDAPTGESEANPNPVAAPQPEPATSEPSVAPPPLVVSLRVEAENAERGQALAISGGVTQAGGRRCAGATVRLQLRSANGSRHALGRLVSDAKGRFAGRLIVPWEVPVGAGQLHAEGLGRCDP